MRQTMQYIIQIGEDSDDMQLHAAPVEDSDAEYLNRAFLHFKPLIGTVVERQLEIPPATIRITGSRLDLEVAHSGDNRGIASNCGMEFRDN